MGPGGDTQNLKGLKASSKLIALRDLREALRRDYASLNSLHPLSNLYYTPLYNLLYGSVPEQGTPI